jgi:Uma2 family endonuclease
MTDTALAPLYIELPDLDLPAEDGEPLETHHHHVQMDVCIHTLRYAWRDRPDYFVGGNMFIYYSLDQARDVIAEVERKTTKRAAYRGPDVFVVLNIDGARDRKSWIVWEEGGRYPDVIIELLSLTTAQMDLTTKKDLYERTFHTQEYYVWDPFDPGAFTGWRLREGQYEPIEPNTHGWRWSEQLKLWLGPWEGEIDRVRSVWLRYYDPEGNLLPTSEEDAKAERQSRLVAEQRAAEAEQRAEALAAELERLRGKRGRSSRK